MTDYLLGLSFKDDEEKSFEKIPLKIALKKYLEPTKKPKGKTKRTWIKQILEDIKNNSNIITHQKDERLEINKLKEICGDRKRWRRVIRDMMLQ